MDTAKPAFSVEISEDDIYESMRELPGYLDITPEDFREVYRHAYEHAYGKIAFAITAQDIMTTRVHSVHRKALIREAAGIMAGQGISGMPVVDDGHCVVGIISERDFLRLFSENNAGTTMGLIVRLLEQGDCCGKPLQGLKAEDIMTSPAITVSEGSKVDEIVNLFTERTINRAPVVDTGGCLRGIVTRSDILKAPLKVRR
ncbi:MAG: CBS domain-containing protein [Pseudomonadota bacterium]